MSRLWSMCGVRGVAGAVVGIGLLVGLVGLSAAVGPPQAGAQSDVEPVGDVAVDGAVHAIAAGDGATYLGGNFDRVGRRTGPAALFDAQEGASDRSWPDFARGAVLAAVPDGAGGFYVGGTFTHVAGKASGPLVRVDSEGRVDQGFAPEVVCGAVDGCGVRALALSDGVATDGNVCADSCLYVGGAFERIGPSGHSNRHLAAVDPDAGNPPEETDPETGDPVPAWQPRPSGPVHALAVHEVGIEMDGEDGPRTVPLVLAGGEFTELPEGNSNGRKLGVVWGFGAVDRSGEKRDEAERPSSWRPYHPADSSPDIHAIALGSSETDGDGMQSVPVYSGGAGAEGGLENLSAHRLRVQTTGDQAGEVEDDIGPAYGLWEPAPDGGASADRRPVYALAVDHGPSGESASDVLYAGGGFTRIGGEPVHRLAAINPVQDPATGNGADPDDYAGGDPIAGWHPQPDRTVRALALIDGMLYVGGDFQQLGGKAGSGDPSDPGESEPEWRPDFSLDSEGVEFEALAARGEGGQDEEQVVVAVGAEEEAGAPVVFRRAGGRWHRDLLPDAEGAELVAVAFGAQTVWAVGSRGGEEGVLPALGDGREPLVLRLDTETSPDSAEPASWQEVDTGLTAPTSAVALSGDRGYLGDEEGGIHPISDVGAASPTLGEPITTVPGSGEITDIALPGNPDAGPGFAVGGVRGCPLGGLAAIACPAWDWVDQGRFYPLEAGEDVSVAELPKPEQASAAPTQSPHTAWNAPTRLRSVAISADGETALSVDERMGGGSPRDPHVWERTEEGLPGEWTAEGPFALGGAQALRAVSVDEGGTTAGIVGSLSPGDGGSVAWLRSEDEESWSADIDAGAGEELTDIAVLAADDVWAVGSGGMVTRFHDPDAVSAAAGLSTQSSSGSMEESETEEVERLHLAAVPADADADGRGEAEDWDPSPAGGGVRALAISDSGVLAGGAFKLLDWEARHNLAALDSGGEITAWDPGADSSVRALELRGPRLFAGGSFEEIGGIKRPRLAELDPNLNGGSGAIAAFDPPAPNDTVLTLAASGKTLYVGGGFTRVGTARRNRLAAIDTTGASLRRWNPDATGGTGNVLSIDASCEGQPVYVGGSFERISGKERRRLAAVSRRTGAPHSWKADARSTVRAIARDGHTVYAGGDFKTIGGAQRGHIAAVNPRTGEVASWNAALDDTVDAIVAAGEVIYAGGRNSLVAIAAGRNGAPSNIAQVEGRVRALQGHGKRLHAGGVFTDLGSRPQAAFGTFATSSSTPSSVDCSWPPLPSDTKPAPKREPAPEPPAPPPPPPPPPPTAEFIPDLKQGATRVSSFRDLSAWSAFRDGKWRLVLSQGEREWRAPVAGRDVPFDVNVGPGPDRSPLVAYSRCRQEPRVRRATQPLPAWATGRGCDAYVLNPASGNEFRIPGASTGTASEFLPSIWGDAVAFARVFESRDGFRGIVPYIYARRYTRDGRSVRIPGGARGGTGLPGPTSLDFYHHRVLFSWGWEQRSGGQAELRIGTPFRRTQMVFSAGYERSLAQLVTPHGARGRVFFGAQRYIDGSDGVRQGRTQFMRYRISTDQLDHSPAPRFLLSVAPEGDGVVFSVSGDPLASRGCVTNEGGCAVGRFPRLFFRR